ncbi:hypothetical protein SAMN05421693_11963 [Ectothiorhodospira magna]|uniref:TIGR01777 family protein n=1 Tax=Ectothiorhodospira magna TaxID=867345 RepID=A0A1H9E0C1_9GAMM|nr:TIGR01777 family oxidoreductase [Ectothiorhodospira magna]SEQ19156.1 hypothetical protein SAMN05421693_11963 [Ectothiorhodospira magna]
MKILITGGTGFVGAQLIRRLVAQDCECVVLTRNTAKARRKLGTMGCQFISWDTRSPIPKEAFEGVDGAVNLVGESLASRRWSAEQKKRIFDSRIEPTRHLVEGLNEHAPQCKVLVSASAIGYYPVNLPDRLTEDSEPGDGFLPDICRQWEEEATHLNPRSRVVILRFGVVLGRDGGVIGKLLPVFKMGLGGPVSDGSQMMSWIHLEDVIGVTLRALIDDAMFGVYNAVAPEPVTNRAFSKSLGHALGRPAVLTAPAFMLRTAMGEMSTVVLDSQTISGDKLLEAGYEFLYPDIDQAMHEIASG